MNYDWVLGTVVDHRNVLNALAPKLLAMPSYGHNSEGKGPRLEETAAKLGYVLLANPHFTAPLLSEMSTFPAMLEALDRVRDHLSKNDVQDIFANSLHQGYWLERFNALPGGMASLKRQVITVLEKASGWLAGKGNGQLSPASAWSSWMPTSMMVMGFTHEEHLRLAKAFFAAGQTRVGATLYAGSLATPERFVEGLASLTEDHDQARQITRQCLSDFLGGGSIRTLKEQPDYYLSIIKSLDAAFQRHGLGEVIQTAVLNPALACSRLGAQFFKAGFLTPGEPDQDGLFTAMQNDDRCYVECLEIAIALGKQKFLQQCVEGHLSLRKNQTHHNRFFAANICRQAIESGLVDAGPLLDSKAKVIRLIATGVEMQAVLNTLPKDAPRKLTQLLKKHTAIRDFDL